MALGSPDELSDPLMRNAWSSTPSRVQSAMICAARPSFHRIAGPVGAPAASTSQLPSPCAVMAT